LGQYSKLLTVLPLILGFAFVGLEMFGGFTITESQVSLIEFMIGGTIFGGVATSGMRKFKEYKEKQN